MGPMPLLPATMPRQASSTPVPTGQTIPSPVTTTRRLDMLLTSCSFPSLRESFARPGPRRAGRRDRPPTRLLLVRVDVVDRVLDGLDVLGLLVGDLDLELLLHRHDELDDVERVRAEVLDEARGDLDLLLRDAELLSDDALDLRLHVG